MKRNAPPQLSYQENRDCNADHTQRMNHAVTPVYISHISKVLSPYNPKTMLPFTSCHEIMLIFSL